MAAPLLLKAYFALTAAAPWLLTCAARRQHARQNAAPERLPERFGKASQPRPEGKLIWLHAASVGEVQSIAALTPRLAADATLLVTSATATGATRAAAILPEDTLQQFQPVDTPGAVRAFLAHWQPDLALFVEGDLWPRMCRALAQSGTPAALLNARASRSRTRFPAVYREMLAPFRLITCQSEAVLEELSALGLPAGKLASFGDLKAELPPATVDAAARKAFQQACAGRPLWAAVSTHAADEAPVLAAHRALLKTEPKALLLWLPRHPARAAAIRAAASGLTIAQRSLGEAVIDQTQILLADTLGEAGAAFASAPTVFLGGSFGPEGGHTPYEPVKAGAFVLSGPNVANFRDAYAQLECEGYAKTVPDSTALAKALISRLSAQHIAPWQGHEANTAAKTATELLRYLA